MILRAGVTYLLTLFILMPAFADKETTRTESKRGAFSLSPIYGQTWHRLVSSEGKSILYSGQHYGLEASLSLFEPLSVFAETRITDATNDKFSSEKLTGQGYSLGLRLETTTWLEFGIAFGQERDTIKSSSSPSSKVVNQTLAANMTIHIYDFSESFGIFFQANYRLGNAAASKNGNGSYNSGLDATEVNLGLRWSPSVDFTYTK